MKNYLKNKNKQNKLEKKLHFSKLILKYKNTWEIIEECMEQKKCNHQTFSEKILKNKQTCS